MDPSRSVDQIEDLGRYFQQQSTRRADQSSFSLSYSSQEQPCPEPSDIGDRAAPSQVTSPPSSFAEFFRPGDGLETGLGFKSDYDSLMQSSRSNQNERRPPLVMSRPVAQVGGRSGSASATQCRTIWSSVSDEDSDSIITPDSSKRGSRSGSAPEDRGLMKKSREKLRRQEVNVKFVDLVQLLGLSSRLRKTSILQETISAIKALKRERDEMERDRDRLQQEATWLTTRLHYSHVGAAVAASDMANIGPSGHPSLHRYHSLPETSNQAPHMQPLNVHVTSDALPSPSSGMNLQLSRSASFSEVSGRINIAPKPLKPKSPTSS